MALSHRPINVVEVVMISYRIFVAIKTDVGKSEDVRQRLKSERIVREACTVYSGPYDVVIFIDVPSLEDYQRFVLDTLPRVNGISDYESFITIES